MTRRALLRTTACGKSCAIVSKQALAMIESKPGAYKVWVDTKALMGELRGTLSAGMAHMAGM